MLRAARTAHRHAYCSAIRGWTAVERAGLMPQGPHRGRRISMLDLPTALRVAYYAKPSFRRR